jgi:Zinc-finger of C2H2 type
MIVNDSKKLQKVAQKMYCKICDYTTSRKSSFDKHIASVKHKNMENGSKMVVNDSEKLQKVAKQFVCVCGKIYKYDSGYYRHKKSCFETDIIKNDENNTTDKDLVMMLVKQNSDLMEVIKNGTHNNNTTNSNNKTISHNKNNTFNLQFFLNETCKDAMNITDFVDSIQLQLPDLESVGKLGYVEGISNIIIKKLNAIDVSQRPIHCTDKKREVLYIKDENKWEKDNDEKKKIRKVIKKVANKNARLLPKFKEAHPDCGKSASLFSDQYNKIIVESMGGSGDNDLEKEDKIIKKISGAVIVDK